MKSILFTHQAIHEETMLMAKGLNDYKWRFLPAFSILLISTGETLPFEETLSYTSSKACRQYGNRSRKRS